MRMMANQLIGTIPLSYSDVVTSNNTNQHMYNDILVTVNRLESNHIDY